jgi:uncharacterized protein YlxW (UPF0749 family)
MSDTKVVVELAGVNLPLGQFMELACKRMTLDMVHETGKWESLQRLEQLVETQRDEIRALQKQYAKLETTVDTLFKVLNVGRQRFPVTPTPAISDED